MIRQSAPFQVAMVASSCVGVSRVTIGRSLPVRPDRHHVAALHELYEGDGQAAREARQAFRAVATEPAFRIPMTRHRAERFAFSIDGIG